MRIHNTGKKLKQGGFYSLEDEDLEEYELSPKEKKRFSKELVQETKRAIRQEKALADKGKHVKVTAQNGIITLNGIVFSKQEKMSIGDKAAAVTGLDKVKNYIEVIG